MRALLLPAICWHLLVAPVLWVAPNAGHATSMQWLSEWLGNRSAAGALVVVSLLALYGIRRDRTTLSRGGSTLAVGFLVPQALVLLGSARAAVVAIAAGAYADGTVIPAEHIYADQLPYMVAVVLYVLAALWPYLPWSSRWT